MLSRDIPSENEKYPHLCVIGLKQSLEKKLTNFDQPLKKLQNRTDALTQIIRNFQPLFPVEPYYRVQFKPKKIF